MTEQEYINVSELKLLTSALNTLGEITPKNSNIISPDDFGKIIHELTRWRDKYFNVIQVD